MSNLVQYNPDQISLLKKTLAAGSTDDEFSLFINQCQRTGLDPFTRQIYFIKDKKGKVTVCASIDGLRLIAERSEKYEGQTKPEWCGPDGVWKDIWLSQEPPSAARVGVWKEKFREPTYGVALFEEYAGRYPDGGLTYMWAKMPALMLAKVAEALGLRKAFPNDLSGIYSSEEAEVIEVKSEKQAASANSAQVAGGAAEGDRQASSEPSKKPANEQSTKAADPKALPLQKDASGSTKSTRNEAPISLTDLGRLYDVAYIRRNWSKKDVDLRVQDHYKIDSPSKLKKYQFELIMDSLENRV